MSPERAGYEDFRLLVEAGAGGGEYRTSVMESPAGEAAPETVHWSAGTGRLAKEDDLRRVGASLFDAFIAGPILDLYRGSIAFARERRRGLRLKLTIGSRDLVHAPWELLYDTQNRSFVGLSSTSPIVRHPRVSLPMDQLTVEPPLRVLGMVASPRSPSLPQLDVKKERKLIDDALAEAVKHGLVTLRWVEDGTYEALRKAVQEGWHAFHYCGHGDYDTESGEGFLILEDERRGPYRLRAGDLGILLRREGGVRLAVLNSCKGAAADDRRSSLSCADALMTAGVGGVAAMQNPISDRAALTFARVTYLAIASGLPLEAAIGSARVAMKLAPRGPIEWWTPVLHLRARSGVLFDLPAPAATPRIKGTEYLGPDLDRRMEQALRRRKRIGRTILAWLLLPIPLLAYLMATPVSSEMVTAEVQASAVSFTLAAEHEFFSELPRLASFSARGFRQATLPGSAFPLRPAPGAEARIRAEAADSGSWISLQPWILPQGTRITLDHPGGALRGEYALSLVSGAGRRLRLGLVHRIRLARPGAPPELLDYGDTSSMELVTSNLPLELELRTSEMPGLTLPPLAVDSLVLARQGFGDEGPLLESTVLTARLRLDRRHTKLDTVSLRLGGLRDGALRKFRLSEGGVGFSVTGTVEQVAVGGEPLEFISRFQWLVGERAAWLGLGGLAYILVLLAGALSWRTTHVARADTQ